MDKTCKACNRIYSSKGNLDKHVRCSEVCQSWMRQIGDKEDAHLYDLIQSRYISTDDVLKALIPSIIGKACEYCRKTFESGSALHKHMRSSVVCDKWRQHHLLTNAQRLLSDQLMQESAISFKPPCDSADIGTYAEFQAPKYSICHIIWNVLLVDKEFIKKMDFKEVCEENKVEYIVSILPNEEVFKEAVTFDIDHSLMLYSGHDTHLDIDRFDEECAAIERHRSHRNNIIIFCNNGYQRSLPLIVYYLTKFHGDEIPSIERAIDIILPQVDKDNYATNRDNTIESVTLLFQKNGVI